MYVYGANGKLALHIPIKHTKTTGHQRYKDVRIEQAFGWQKQHWKSLETAYRTSPFFEFYEDDLRPIFERSYEFLMDLNFETITTVCDLLQLELSDHRTSQYGLTPKNQNTIDYRSLVNAKKPTLQPFTEYTQVFDSKHGYLNNLSILDLLCNEGPNATNYLETQKLEVH